MKSTFAVAAFALCATTSAFAGSTTLDFETVTSFASIGQYYNGGADGAGKVGPALGVAFGGDALGLLNDFDTYFTHAPSALGVMAPVGVDATMNVASGFSGAFSFFYSSSATVRNGVQLWSGLGGTGSLLASFDLLSNAQSGGCSDSAFCHFDELSSGFAGKAYSATFGNAAGAAAFDNVSITPVPEPSTVLLMALGLAGLAAVAARRR